MKPALVRLPPGIALISLLLLCCGTDYAQPGLPPQRPMVPPAGIQRGQRPDLVSRRESVRHETERTPAVLKNTHIPITLGQHVGPLKPLLGINAGPVPSGEPGNADLTEQYRWAGVREVRTQDFYGPLDLSTIFPRLDADPASPAAYDFALSDRTFAAILKAGLEPYLRLGDSYNNVRVPSHPDELKNYSGAAVSMVQHYRQGALNGFRSTFRCVEIGNEPDNQHFWPGRYEDFFPYFVRTYKELKRRMPDLKVGGPGFVVASYKIPALRPNVTRFLAYLKQNGVHPDFISFHLYSNDPAEYYDLVQFYRRETEKQGLAPTELHISEWNTEKGGAELRVGRKAAPYVTACWIALQQAGVDASYLFRGTDTNIDNPGFYGIFFADGGKKPAAYAFHLWSRMARFTERVDVRTGDEQLDAEPRLTGALKPVWVLAGQDNHGQTGLLIANIGAQQFTYELALPQPIAGLEMLEFDNPRGGLTKHTPPVGAPLSLKPFSVQFVEIRH